MAKYMVVHTPLIAEAEQAQLFDMLRSIAQAEIPDTEWVSSWLSVDSRRMFCLWEAPNEESIRAAIGDVLEVSPIDSTYEVVLVDPDYFA